MSKYLEAQFSKAAKEDYVKVTNLSNEYYKNGNVKAYRSIISHSKLNEEIKVRNRDYDLYSASFDDAVSRLNTKWYALRLTEVTSKFINDLEEFHSYYKDGRRKITEFSDFKRKVSTSHISVPSKPVIPIYNFRDLPDKENKKYKFNLSSIEKFFLPIIGKRVANRREMYYLHLQKHYEKELELIAMTYQHYIQLNSYNDQMVQYNASVEEVKKEVASFNEYLDNVEKGFVSRQKGHTEKYIDMMTSDMIDRVDLVELEIDKIQYDRNKDTIILDVTMPSEYFYPKTEKYKDVKKDHSIKETLYSQKKFNDNIINSYLSIMVFYVNLVMKISSRKPFTSIAINGKRYGEMVTRLQVDVKDFVSIYSENVDLRSIMSRYGGKYIRKYDASLSIKPISVSRKEKPKKAVAKKTEVKRDSAKPVLEQKAKTTLEIATKQADAVAEEFMADNKESKLTEIKAEVRDKSKLDTNELLDDIFNL